MRTQAFNITVESTQDCVNLIDPFKQPNFKRKAKFNINSGHEQRVVRVFVDKDSNQEFSLVSEEKETIVFAMDISVLKDTIKEIQDNAKKVYTHDYGEVWLNPWTRKVWVSGGDGGIVRWEGSPKKLAKMMEEEGLDGIEDDSENLGFDTIAGVEEVIIEAECSPVNDKWEDDIEYISVAVCKDISDYMEW